MAETKNIQIGGRLHSIATGNVLTGADEILDDNKGKKQSEINMDVDEALADRYTKDETYNKNELNSLITTPDVQYISIIATEQTTAVTDILPSVGAANTIYRVGKWNGTQYNTAVYSEYAWNSTAYVLLDVKEYGIDAEPTAGSDNLVKSGGVVKVLNDTLGLENHIEFSNQGIIKRNGTISGNQYYKYSDPISIKQGYQVTVFSMGADYAAICQCDSSGNFIQTLVGVPATPVPTERVLYTWTNDGEDCYIRVCGQFYYEGEYAEAWYLGDTGKVLKKSDIDDNLDITKTNKVVSNARVAELNNEVQEINEALRRVDIELGNPGIISSNGVISSNDYYKYSDPIFIKNGWTVKVLTRGASFLAVSKCDSSGTYISRIINVPATPVPTERVLYTWTNDGEDCYIRVCGQFYYEGEYAEAWYLGDIIHDGGGNTDVDLKEQIFTAELSMVYTDGNGNIIQYDNNANVEANSRKSVATIYWIEIGKFNQDDTIQCVPFASINNGETYKVFFYNSNYSVISNAELTSEGQYETTIPTGTKFLKLFVSSSEDLTYSIRYVEVKVKTDLLRWHGVRNFLTTSDYLSPIDSTTPYGTTLKYYRTIFEVPYKGQRLWNVGLFFYSPFYKPVGEKTKLVILYQGSDGYKFNKGWNAFSDNYHSIVFSLVHSGYNVALCSCLTSLYGPTSSSSTVSDCSGDQLSINAYQKYYEYLVKNFNVENEPYIIGYSNGGMPCGRINVLGDIKAKAIAGGAIITDLVGLLRILGAVVNINKILHNCGVSEDVNVENKGYNFTTSDFEIIKSQGDILKNYSPMFMSCEGLDWNTYIDTMKNVPFTNIETNQAMIQLMSNVKIQSEIPIKIWIARDDVNVSYGIEKFYVEAVNRGGGRAFLRTMPNNAGKHAMGNYGDANSLKIQNYHFKDGTVADTTLFMSEVIEWFEQWK